MTKSPPRARGSSALPRPNKAVKSTSASALTQARTRRDVSQETGKSEVWQARIGADLAEQLRSDAEVLGLEGRTDIVKAALELLHRRAAQERMARSVDEYYGDSAPPLPPGVIPPDVSS